MENSKMIVEIENLSPRQISAFEKLFVSMQVMGSIGTSRNITIFCDGDGSFRPKFKINGNELKIPVINEGEYKGCVDPNTYEKPNVCFQ